jgi:hypothetical protein
MSHALQKGKARAILRQLNSTVRADASRGPNGRRLYPSACQSARAQPNNRLEPTRMSPSKLDSRLAAQPPAVIFIGSIQAITDIQTSVQILKHSI